MHKLNTLSGTTPPNTPRRVLLVTPSRLCAHGMTVAGQVLGRLTQAGVQVVHVDSQRAALAIFGDPHFSDIHLVASETDSTHDDITALLERRDRIERLVFTPFSAPQHA